MVRRSGNFLIARWLMTLFVLCALPTGILLALRTPIAQVADEPAHIARADGLLSGQILGFRMIFTKPTSKFKFPISGVNANEGLVNASISEYVPGPPRALSPKRLAAAEAITWTKSKEFDVAPNTVQYFPFFYLPGSIGIEFGRLTGYPPLASLYAGRLMMVLSYVAMGTAALFFAGWGRGVLFTVLMMPMAISLGASFNQDGQLFAATALACALLTADPATHRLRRLIGIILLVLLICSKPPYGLLLFVALVPVAAPNLIRRFLKLSLFAIPPIIWVILMAIFSMVVFNWPAYHPGPLWPGSPTRIFHSTSPPDNLRVLLAHPLDFIILPVNLLVDQSTFLCRSAVGMLGWLSIDLHPWQYMGWYAATITAILGLVLSKSTWRITTADTFLVLALVLLTVVSIELAQYLSWTKVGYAEIQGVTGRYFLLLLPFLILGAPRLGDRIDRASGHPGTAATLETLSAIPAAIMAILDVWALPALITRLFHT
ncbi:MAG: DUF2142 domain-containing protein [Acidiphilium sp.]|nr:DUF2142 domain-containing protein [Acidiphilium sp.]